MREGAYQKQLIDKLLALFPDAMVIKNDPEQTQGIPDLLIVNGPNWAMLEVKASPEAPLQPNQEYYVEILNDMSYATIIHPGNEESVLDALQSTLGSRR